MAKTYAHITQLLATSYGHCDSVLELGCGAKQYGHCFSGQYWGIDLEFTYLTETDPGPDALANAEALPFADESMDLVFTVATLLVIPDTDSVLREARRVLRPGGSLLIFDYSPWVARRLARHDANHRHRFSSKRLSQKLLDVGFEAQIHRDCVPLRGGPMGRKLLSLRSCRRLVYYISNWIVVSGSSSEP